MDAGFNVLSHQTYTARAKALYLWNHLHYLWDYSVSYGQAAGIVSANRMDGNWRTDFDLGKRFFTYVVIGSGYDEIRRIDLYYQAGPGLGYKLINRTNMTFNATFGSSYQEYWYSDHSVQSSAFLNFGQDLMWAVLPKLTWTERAEFAPHPERFSEYRLRLESSLQYPLAKNLFLNLTALDLYDTHPVAGVNNNDLQLRTTLGLKF